MVGQTSGQPWTLEDPTMFIPRPLPQPFLCRQEGLLFCTPAWERVGG